MGTHLVLAPLAQASATQSSWGWGAWAWLVLPLTIYGLISLALFGFGQTDERNPAKFFFRQISDSLERATGFPGWSMAGVLSGLLFLLVVVIGFYWDVAWHVDFGRDTQLFTPSHVMILVGLGGVVWAATIAVVFASIDEADVGLSLLGGRVRVPWSALVLYALGIGGVAAFPLDNLWHQTYGIDVTLWSPTHLQLVAGGSLATIGLWLMTAEALRSARPNLLGKGIFVLTSGTILVGMSTFQGEFDFGVPQFQLLYLPLLVVIAAGFTLVATRIALGRWGAVKVALVYLALRAFLAAVVGGALHHTVPRFPLYLPSALAVEAAAWWLGTRRRSLLAVASGVLVATVGLGGELAWVALSGWWPHLPADLLLKTAVLAPLAAVAAALLGAGLARAFAPPGRDGHIPVAQLALAGVVLLGVLAFPLPRNVGHVNAVIRLQRVGDLANVEVQLDPPGAAKGATAFGVKSWQGGGTVTARLDEVGPGLYRSSRAVPVTGRWKSTVGLQRGDQVMAAPIYLPADVTIGASAVPAVPVRTVTFQRNTAVLQRESHGGPVGPAVAAYTGLAVLMVIWVTLMAATALRTSPDEDTDERDDTRRAGGEPAWTGAASQGAPVRPGALTPA